MIGWCRRKVRSRNHEEMATAKFERSFTLIRSIMYPSTYLREYRCLAVASRTFLFGGAVSQPKIIKLRHSVVARKFRHEFPPWPQVSIQAAESTFFFVVQK